MDTIAIQLTRPTEMLAIPYGIVVTDRLVGFGFGSLLRSISLQARE